MHALAERPTLPGRSADLSSARALGRRDVTALGDSVGAWTTAQPDAGEDASGAAFIEHRR